MRSPRISIEIGIREVLSFLMNIMKITSINQHSNVFYIRYYLNVSSLPSSLQLKTLRFRVTKIPFNVRIVNCSCTQLLSEGLSFDSAYKEARKVPQSSWSLQSYELQADYSNTCSSLLSNLIKHNSQLIHKSNQPPQQLNNSSEKFFSPISLQEKIPW